GERPAQELALDAHRPLGRDPAGEAEPPIEAGPDRVELPVRLGILGRAGLGEEPRHVHLRAQPPEDRRPAVARDQRAQEPDRPRRELPREIRELALLDEALDQTLEVEAMAGLDERGQAAALGPRAGPRLVGFGEEARAIVVVDPAFRVEPIDEALDEGDGPERAKARPVVPGPDVDDGGGDPAALEERVAPVSDVEREEQRRAGRPGAA